MILVCRYNQFSLFYSAKIEIYKKIGLNKRTVKN